MTFLILLQPLYNINFKQLPSLFDCLEMCIKTGVVRQESKIEVSCCNVIFRIRRDATLVIQSI